MAYTTSSQEPDAGAQGAMTPAMAEFNTSSIYTPPPGYAAWQIKNDYPHGKPHVESYAIPGDAPGLPLPEIEIDSPWRNIDFREDPVTYAKLVKEYCWEGNRAVDFVIQKNTVRQWFHAPWMHKGANGREPIHGLTYERPTPAHELSHTQKRGLQSWAIGFYNAPGASVFGNVWADPNKPVWDKNLKFPPGTAVFKLLFSTATNEEVPTMKGSPLWKAVIAKQKKTGPAPPTGEPRGDEAKDVRLIQVDWAVVDHRSPVGWVFGTWMYDGFLEDIQDPWDRLTLVGVIWGNDPELTDAKADAGEKPKESFITERAEWLLKDVLKGKRGTWGWKGRLNGPADNFISACTSCHGTAQSFKAPMTQPGSLDKKTNKFIPLNKELSMTWFENVQGGTPFSTRGALSSDYSLQFVVGWNNYTKWKSTQDAQDAEPDPQNKILLAVPGRRVVYRPIADAEDPSEAVHVEDEPARSGPTFEYNPDV